MKTRKILKDAALALAAVALAFAACGDTWEEEAPRPTFGLRSVTVQPVEFDVDGLPVDSTDPLATAITVKRIPRPIIEANWDDTSFNPAEGDSEELWFLLEEHTQTARLIVEASAGTVVSWALGTAGSKPLKEFTRPGEPLEFRDNDVIYIRVAMREYTGDVQYSNYYRIHARLASGVTMLSLLTVAGRDTETPYDAGRDNWGDAKADGAELAISITLKDGDGSDIIATKNDERSSVSYAIIRGDYTTVNENTIDTLFTDFEGDAVIPVWDPSVGKNGEYVNYDGVKMSFDDQDWLIAKVTAQNQTDKSYYKFRVSVGRIADIKKLTLTGGGGQDGPVTDYEVAGLGVPHTAWGNVILGNFATANRNPEFSVDVELEDGEGAYEFVKIGTGSPALPGSFTSPESITFGNKEALAIKVTSATEIASTPAVTKYYKVQIDLLSAIIEVQPKSAVYNVESHSFDVGERVLVSDTRAVTLKETIQPLEAVLDRDGTFTYQWYTANSWYGGYGFDKDGRIVGDSGFIYDAYHPKTSRGPGEGGFDEKNNVSFHNGGNQFYRLPVGSYPDSTETIPESSPATSYKAMHDALAISGATSAKYTPVFNAGKRPFIAGQSNQTQYYWVVIKDAAGRSVTSEWAAVVTEWGENWDLGRPTGVTVNKMHHIVNLNAYNEGGPGLQATPRNIAPFTFHREKRIIPINFPSGFSIMNYTVATIQAKFYLGDGTVWIQNWTQGDVGFERNGAGLVLWYNLTNNNAAVGLSGDSKEPQGASITETPTHVVIKPAGEKPPKSRPPFLADGKTPENIDDAQGWFTPYIEIVELRFEGPRR